MRLLNVSQLNTYLREILDADDVLHDLWIEGEIFDFKQHTSGHWYFKLRDGNAAINAVCWRSSAARIAMRPRNGDAVLVHGRVGFYEVSGVTQIYADMLQPAGVGLLHAQFESLKARLEAEGLFEAARKRALPSFPRRIGVVTSTSGAAIRDILHVLGRRYPLAEVLIAPCQVQGSGAADTIVEALYALYDQDVDVIIVARGGGSMEDLWAFNEECVARAVFASPVPVVSGVGHETDTTIIDYVADLRAPTPSAAAELAVPDMAEVQDDLANLDARLALAMRECLRVAHDELVGQQRRLAARSPLARMSRDRQAIDELLRRASAQAAHQIALRRAQLDGLRAQVAALSPLATLERGYAVVRRAADGRVVSMPEQVEVGASIEITVRGGSFEARRVV